jgi:hypothetical protein
MIHGHMLVASSEIICSQGQCIVLEFLPRLWPMMPSYVNSRLIRHKWIHTPYGFSYSRVTLQSLTLFRVHVISSSLDSFVVRPLALEY